MQKFFNTFVMLTAMFVVGAFVGVHCPPVYKFVKGGCSSCSTCPCCPDCNCCGCADGQCCCCEFCECWKWLDECPKCKGKNGCCPTAKKK